MKLEISVTKENTRFFPIHSHDKWEYMLYTKGIGVLKTEQKNYPFKEGTFIAIPPGIRHGSSSNEAFVNICIHTDKKLLPVSNCLTVFEGVTNEIKLLFELISRVYFNNVESEEAISYLMNALESLISKSGANVGIERTMLEIRNYISDNFTNPDCSVSDIIKRFGISDDYCRIQYKKLYGITPHEHLTRLRMDYAKTLLTNYGDVLKIFEIAEMCGFKDSLYFSRQFKKYFGFSPKKFIK